MRSYLLITSGKENLKDGYCFEDQTGYSKRLIKDVGLYGVYYLLYNKDTKTIIEEGRINKVDYYEDEKSYKALFEERKSLSKSHEMELKENYFIIPLNQGDLKTIGTLE